MIAGELLGHKTVNGLNEFYASGEAFKIVNNLKNKDKIIKGMKMENKFPGKDITEDHKSSSPFIKK